MFTCFDIFTGTNSLSTHIHIHKRVDSILKEGKISAPGKAPLRIGAARLGQPRQPASGSIDGVMGRSLYIDDCQELFIADPI